jgi:transposase
MRVQWMAAMREARVPKRYRLRVQERLSVLEYATTHGNKGAARRFGFDRKTIRKWRALWKAQGISGLIPRYPTRRARPVAEKIRELVERARLDFGYGIEPGGANSGR